MEYLLFLFKKKKKKNNTSASKTILALHVASVASLQPFPKENLSLNSQRILSKKDLTELHMLNPKFLSRSPNLFNLFTPRSD